MRELARNITRRIGNTVCTLTPEGIVVRRFRRKRATGERLIGWAEMLAMSGADPLPTRDEAFLYELPPDWLPEAGDPVYLNRDRTGLTRGTVVHVIPAVPEVQFLVRMPRGGEQLFERRDLRPAPKKTPRQKDAGQQQLLP